MTKKSHNRVPETISRRIIFNFFNLAAKEETMTKVVHRSHITITREKGPTRKAEIEGFSEPVFYGVHGGIKDFYKIEPEEEHAATLDHIVGAVGG
jgi:hypothetical protein